MSGVALQNTAGTTGRPRLKEAGSRTPLFPRFDSRQIWRPTVSRMRSSSWVGQLAYTHNYRYTCDHSIAIAELS